MVAVHELKTWPMHFQAVYDGRKTFEMRFSDRDYMVGDFVWLREYEPRDNIYSGRSIVARITYILSEVEESPEFIADNWVILSYNIIAKDESPYMIFGRMN